MIRDVERRHLRRPGEDPRHRPRRRVLPRRPRAAPLRALAAAHPGAVPGRHLGVGAGLRRPQRGGDLHHRPHARGGAEARSTTSGRAPRAVGRDPERHRLLPGACRSSSAAPRRRRRRKAAELRPTQQPARATPPTWAAAWASTSPRSTSTTPIGELEQYNTQGIVKGLIDSAPDKTWTFGDLLANRSIEPDRRHPGADRRRARGVGRRGRRRDQHALLRDPGLVRRLHRRGGAGAAASAG